MIALPLAACIVMMLPDASQRHAADAATVDLLPSFERHAMFIFAAISPMPL